jgi:nitrogen regulatory protein P-II 1
MMEVKAIIRPNKLAILRSTLVNLPEFPGMTISKAEGFGAPARSQKVNLKDELTDYSAKIRIEIVCNDEFAQVLMDKIVSICQTGQIGDGVVWCTPVVQAYFIAKTTP